MEADGWIKKVSQSDRVWGGFIHPIAVCEECKEIIEGTPYIIETDSTVLTYRHQHALSFLILRRDENGRRYEIEGEGSPDLLNLLKQAGEVWRMPSLDVRRDVSDVCLYIRQRLVEI